MKEVKILAWCDSCASVDRKEPATTDATVTIAPGGPLTIDLCGTCRETVVQPLEALLAEYGQAGPRLPSASPVVTVPTPKTSSPRQRCTCPICSTTRSARWPLAYHIWRDHLGEERPAPPLECPDCGYAAPHSSRPTAAVGRHRANVHGYDPLTEPLARYEKAFGALERKPA